MGFLENLKNQIVLIVNAKITFKCYLLIIIMLLFLLSNCYFRRWRRWRWSNNKFLSPPYHHPIQYLHHNSLNKFLSNFLSLWKLSLVQVLFIYFIFILTKQVVLAETNQTITPLTPTLPNNRSILSNFELMINADEESTEEPSITGTTDQQGI